MFRLRRPALPLRLQPLEDRTVPSTGWDRPHVPGELMVQLQSTDALFDLTGYAVSRRMSGIDLQRSRLMVQDVTTGLVHVKLKPGHDVQSLAGLLDQCAGVAWVSPNYVYSAEQVRPELVPDDPYYLGKDSKGNPLPQQYAIDKLKLPDAWDISVGKPSIVVAVLDEGISYGQFSDLGINRFWANDDSGSGGVDDDGNGFIDDLRGWDFVGNDNSPTAETSYHGNFVAGILAGTTNNSDGIAGVAGGNGTTGTGVRIMPIRIYSGFGTLDSVKLAGGLTYAADNGAKIINMSLKSDAFADDPSVVTALDYAYDTKKALVFFSAGNGNEANPPRGVLTHPLFVAATDQNDVRWSESPTLGSNYGAFVDIAAPGKSIVSLFDPNTTEDRYLVDSGTSAAAPHAAGIAALIWSANPTLSRDQVAAKLLNTTDNIDAQNPGFVGQLGTGRANALRAVTETLPAPKLGAITGLPAEGSTTTSLGTISIQAPWRFDATSVVPNSFELRADGGDGVIDTADDVIVPVMVSKYRMGSAVINVTPSVPIASDQYRFTVKSGSHGLRNPFGVALDANGDGIAGDGVDRTFSVLNNQPTTIASLRSFGDTEIKSGQTVTAPVTGIVARFSAALPNVGNGSATNLDNWSLTIDGTDKSSLIRNITYADNDVTGAHEAFIHLNSRLPEGKCTLTAKQSILDNLGNPIDGDSDGSPGGDYVSTFPITYRLLAPIGTEIQVNWDPSNGANPVVAMHSDGSYVVAWAQGYMIFYRLFDASGNPILGETNAISIAPNAQPTTPSIGIAANGDFVIAWETYIYGGPSAFREIQARRFHANGTPNGLEFLVNSITSGNQSVPSVAIEADGDFVIAWTTHITSTGEIFARQFNADGTPSGPEFLVNQWEPDIQTRPKVAVDSDGDFIVTWQSRRQESSLSEYGVYARRFLANGTPMESEFLVNTSQEGNQLQPSIGIAPDDSFVIAYSSQLESGGTGDRGIYFQRFSPMGQKVGVEVHVNQFSSGMQELPQIAIDHIGNFIISWQSDGCDGSSYGIAARRYYLDGSALTPELLVNSTYTNRQENSFIASNGLGDKVVAVWNSLDNGSYMRVLSQRFGSLFEGPPTSPGIAGVTTYVGMPSTVVNLFGVFDDTNDPDAALLFIVTGNSNPAVVTPFIDTNAGALILNPATSITGSTTITVRCVDTFGFQTDVSFEMAVLPPANAPPSFVAGPNIVVPTNYTLQAIPNWATNISAGPANEYSQLITFEIDPNYDQSLFSVQPTVAPTGTLTFDPADGKFGAAVLRIRAKDDGGTANGGIDVSPWQVLTITVTPGFDHSPIVGGARVNDKTAGVQNSPAVATDAVGNYVVVWVDDADIYIKRYGPDRQSTGTPVVVNDYATGAQTSPQVAMNAAGAFVVTWAGEGPGDVDGIFAQMFHPSGAKNGAAFRVNQDTTGIQFAPQVGIDSAGGFVFAWEGPTGISYRRFSAVGAPIDANDVAVTALGTQPALAVDYEGDFVIAWTEATDIRASFFTAAGTPVVAGQLINTYTTDVQSNPAVAVDADGDAVIAWQSQNQVAGGGWDLYSQKLNRFGAKVGIATPLNTITDGDQTAVRIALDADGDLIAAWQSPGANGLDVFHRFFDYQGLALQTKELRVNRVTTDDQKTPAVATDSDGDFVIAWEGRGSVDIDGQIAVQRNSFFPPEGLPNIIVDGGITETSIPLLDYYMNDPSSAELGNTSLYNVLSVSTVALFDSNNNGIVANEEVAINKTTGVLAINYKDRRHGNSNITIRVRDTTELPLNVTFGVSVRPLIDPVTPPALTAGLPWQWNTTGSISAEVGHAIGYSLIGAPSGMTIDDKTGQINWTPTTPGTVNFTIRATDFVGSTPTSLFGDRLVSLDVNQGAPQVQSLTINDGNPQRSRISTMTVTFNSKVDFLGDPLNAFTVDRTGPGLPTGAVIIAGVDLAGSTMAQTIAKLSFSGSMFVSGSLIDGNYELKVLAGQVSANGLALDGNDDGTPGDDHSATFHRLFGDADGNRSVTAADFNAFRLAYGTSGISIFDFNDDGQVSAADFNEFRLRYGIMI